MIDLTNTQKDAIGLNYVLGRMTCRSSYGGEKMRQIAPFGSGDEARLTQCFDNMEKIMAMDARDMENLGNLLGRFKNIRGIVAKLEVGTLSQVEFFEIKNFLLVFAEMDINLPLEGIFFTKMVDVLDILDPAGQRIAPFSLGEGFSADLAALRRDKARLEHLLQQEVDQGQRAELLTQRAKIVAAEDAEEMRVLEALSAKLRPYIPVFCANMDNLGLLDFTMAKANLAQEYGAVRPEISENRLAFKNMYNPMVAEVLTTKNRVMTKVSITLEVGATIMTGANMGGKTVAMQTAVLNAALGRMGFFVFADGAEIPLFDGICMVAEDMQGTGHGLSSFGADVVQINDIICHSRNNFLLIAMDEPARATNPAEGAAIVRALAAFMAQKNCVCLINTHYDRIVRPGMRHYQVAGLRGGSTMDYNLVEVDADTAPPRDALEICRIMGMDRELLDIIEKECDPIPETTYY
ncbi:MAG: hypothetical protein FWC93_03610 [Defluviitaleaceae bacterium]|nr:hypothetical protein [Defluviitaleaceae bacterium]